MDNDRFYDIGEVSSRLGMEESKIRFYEMKFPELFRFAAGETWRRYQQKHIDALSKIHNCFEEKKYPLYRIKRELLTDQTPLAPSSRTFRKSHKKCRIIGVSSAKGGVGKTTFSVNLAVELAEIGYKVAIFDGDLGLSNVHIFMGVNPAFNLGHVIQNTKKLSEIIVEGPKGIKIISGGSGIFELANLEHDKRESIIGQLAALEGTVDFLIIDTGAGISENVISFLAMADEVYVVTTRDIAAITDAYGLVKILVQNNRDAKIHLVVNRVLSEEHARNVYEKINRCAEKFLKYTIKRHSYIVEDLSCFQSAQNRVPLRMGYPQSYALECIGKIAMEARGRMLFERGREMNSFFGRLFDAPVEIWKKVSATL